MKRLFSLLAIFLAAVSCNKGKESGMVLWTFDAPATKSALSENGAFSWQAGDEIAIYDATSGEYVSFTSATGSGKFSATAPENASFTGTAFYPSSARESVELPASYAYSDICDMPAIQMMYATVSEGSNILRFMHPVAFLTVQIQNALPKMDRISVSSPEASLSGAFTMTDGILPSASGEAGVSVSFSIDSKQDLQFTIPVPVGEYSVLLTAGNEDEPEILKMDTETVNFKRAKLYKLAPADVADMAIVHVVPVVNSYDALPDNDNWD